MCKYLLLLVYLTFGCSPLATLAQLKFKKNDSWRYQLFVRDSFPPHYVQETEKIIRITITGINPDGSANAVYVLESVAIHGSGANFNSADPDTYKVDWGMIEMMALLYQPLEFKIFPNDSVSEPGNTAAVAKAAGAHLGLTNETQDIFASNWRYLRLELKFLFPTLPKQFTVNDEWKEHPWKFKIVNVDKDQVEVAGMPDENNSDSVRVTGSISYTLPRNRSNVQTLKWIGRQTLAGGKALTARDINVLSSPPKAVPADTAWFTTLARMSSTSNWLKVNGESDSAKIAQFLAVNNHRYGNRLAFKLAKLDIYNGSEYMYEQYRNALKDVPSAALAGSSSHLFNKLQNIYYEDADSAMVLLKLLSADRRSLDSWLDQSFAQYLPQRDFDTIAARKEFRSEGVSESRIAEIFEESRKAPAGAQLLMNKMLAEKDSIWQISVRPMSLWNKAMHTTDTAILKSIAADFGQISPAEMTVGKAARYELLVQDILRKSNMPAAADALLDKALSDLTNNQADTAFWTAHPELKNKKAANKNILSHAYYLKYEHTKATDKKSALNYLALAAGTAPKSNADKTYESFYDRALLHSEENYSAHFAKELEALGKPEEAMKVLSKQLVAQPDMLDSTRSFFNAHFPGKSFNAYFRDVLLKEWEDAPDFTLKGMNNENIRLADYRGKWLLLDFWGTWCSPCRKDLPHLNKLAEEINAGKYPGNAILAVSCQEPMETSRGFIAANKYVFPAAHADDKIEKSYKIKGYPTKVLVSPDGKMLDLQFGADYAAILQTYSNAYFTQEKEQPSTIKIDNKKKD